MYIVKLLIEYQYFPPVILYKALQHSTNLVLEQYEKFQKMSYRNRLDVAGSDGRLMLSIPLRRGRDQNALITEILIDNRRPWQSIHFKSIMSCYNRSPWFEFFRDELQELYETPHERLIDWNFTCTRWILQKLAFDVPVTMTDSWKKNYDPEEWTDWRGALRPKTIQSRFPDPPTYRQVFIDRTGFIPHLSILDLLFCEGKNSKEILDQQ